MPHVHLKAPCTIRKLTLAIALALPALTSPITAFSADEAVNKTNKLQTSPINFKIPAQPLADALNAFISASDWQVGFSAELAKNVRATAVDGNYTPEQALKRLLTGSGLRYRLTGINSVTLEKAPLETTKAESTVLKTVSVKADAVREVTDPYNVDYVLPNATSGTKTDTPIMETPLNVQVISKQVLKDQQVITFDQALRNVSGVLPGPRDDGAGGSIYFRGFQTFTYFRNGFRIDNPSSYSMGLNDRQFGNVDSVEVLKGASAILYGRTEPGGMFNVITKQPLDTPYYAASQQFGSYNTYRTAIDSSGPLTDNKDLLYRVNMSYQDQGSFRDGVNTGNFFIAPIVKWNISPRTQATLEMEYQHDTAIQNTGIVPSLNNQLLSIPYSRNYLDPKGSNIQDTYFVGFNWSHQFNEDWSIKHRVQANKNDLTIPLSQSPSIVLPVGLIPTLLLPTGHNQLSMDSYSTGIDLTGHFNTGLLKHTLLFGGDYYRYATNSNYTSNGIVGVNLLNPIQTGTLLTGPIEAGNNLSGLDYSIFAAPDNIFKNQIDNYGLYAQDQIELPYHVHVLGGVRYQNIHELENGIAGGASWNNPVITADALTPRVGLLWQPQQWLSLYGNYVEGFGVNSGITYPDNKSVPPTGAEQWEIGSKTEFFNGRLRATLAYFDLTKTNIATTDLLHQNIGNYSNVTGAARSRGPELDIQGEIWPGWNVIGNYANMDAVITKSNNGDVGDRFYNVPRNIGRVWNTYEIQQGSTKGLKFGGGVTFQDSLIGGFSGVAAHIPGYATIGLMSGYSFNVGKPKITIQLNVDNLLDKQYYIGGANYGNMLSNITGYGYSFEYRNFGMPRTFMGLISVQF